MPGDSLYIDPAHEGREPGAIGNRPEATGLEAPDRCEHDHVAGMKLGCVLVESEAAIDGSAGILHVQVKSIGRIADL